MPRINLVLLTLAFQLSTVASLSQTADKPLVAIQHSVEAKVVFRPWSTKEFGKEIGTVSLIVITSPDGNGDMVILRANEVSGGFTAEVYQQDAASPNSITWSLQYPEDQKSITKQPDGSFHLTELVDGADGGSRKEIFRINDPAL